MKRNFPRDRNRESPLRRGRRKVGWLTSHGTLQERSWSLLAIQTSLSLSLHPFSNSTRTWLVYLRSKSRRRRKACCDPFLFFASIEHEYRNIRCCIRIYMHVYLELETNFWSKNIGEFESRLKAIRIRRKTFDGNPRKKGVGGYQDTAIWSGIWRVLYGFKGDGRPSRGWIECSRRAGMKERDRGSRRGMRLAIGI